MGIAEFIQSNIFLPRLKQKSCLVIYDPDRRYRDICLDLASETVTVIDATENGLESRIAALRELRLFGMPSLRALLKVESANDILLALLSPSSLQERALKGSDTWVQEGRDFLHATLGQELKTRAKADEIWRFVLFSEFVFDLPVDLLDSLVTVPHAPNEAQLLVEDICDRLWSDLRTRSQYIDRAEQVEADLGLPAVCRAIENLGDRYTFSFEERTILKQAIAALMTEDMDRVRHILTAGKIRSGWANGICRRMPTPYQGADEQTQN